MKETLDDVMLNRDVDTIDYNSRNNLTHSEAISRLDHKHVNTVT